MSASTTEPRRVRRAYLWIVIVVLALFAGLTGFWFWAAGRLDTASAQAIEDAQAQGIDIDCSGREVVGYPFRLGLACTALSVDARQDDFRLTAGALMSAAQIYRPNRVVAELEGPMILDTADAPPLDIRWNLAQASATFWAEGLDHFAFVTDDPSVAAVQPAAARAPVFSADRAALHVRQNEGDLDVALSQTNGRVDAPDAPAVPPFDLALDLTVDGAASWLNGALPQGGALALFGGRTGTLRQLEIALTGARGAMDLSGDYRFSEDGLLSGTFDLAIAAPEEVAGVVADAVPELRSIARAVATAVDMPFVSRSENGRRVITITADEGRLSAGFVPLGEVPPLR